MIFNQSINRAVKTQAQDRIHSSTMERDLSTGIQRPVADSIGLIIDETARRLARSHDVIEYCRRGRSQEEIEQFDGVSG
jgi:hypothetical protein